MIDCALKGARNVSKDYGNFGCGGGWIRNYSDFVITEGVVPYDSYRAYELKNGVCEHDPQDVTMQFSKLFC